MHLECTVEGAITPNISHSDFCDCGCVCDVMTSLLPHYSGSTLSGKAASGTRSPSAGHQHG